MTPAVGWESHALYGAAWLSFGAGHSLLAGARLKRFFGAGYRIAFNVIATLHFAAVFTAGRLLLGPPDAANTPIGAIAVHALGWALLLVSIRDYDLGRFSGLTQWRAARAGAPLQDDDGPMVVGGLHRFVRHPLYTAAFMILWGGAFSALGGATAVWGSLYLLLGTWSEEKRLLVRYGDDYRAYRKRVPAFIPWKGRAA